VSSSATALAQRIAAAGPDYFEDNFIRLMQNCFLLRQEPEFANLYLDFRPTLQASQRHFARFKRRSMRVMRRGPEAAASAYDDYRIAVLQDLDTPQLREQLRRRLKKCMNRLTRNHDVDMLETAMFTSVLLDGEADYLKGRQKALPLGAFGLVTKIYEETFDRAMVEIADARDIVGDDLYTLWGIKHHQEDMQAIAAAVERINAFEELAAHIEADPALALAWKRQKEHLVEELGKEIVQMELIIESAMFSPAQVALAMDKMERRYLNRPWSLSRYFTLPAIMKFTRCIQEALDELMSPQKMADIAEKLESLGQNSLESDDERLRALVPHFQAALQNLQDEPCPPYNQVARTMYLLSMFAVWSDVEALSPRWQKLVGRLMKSRFVGLLGSAADPVRREEAS
jgi:hypothetical protein